MITVLSLAAGAALALPQERAADPQSDIGALRREIAELRDDVPEEVIAGLAEIGTREAAEALIAGYDDLASIWMRREVVRALSRFGALPEAAELAFAKIAEVAITESAPELHEEAVDLLAASPALGRPCLRRIAAAPARAAVRERAMRRHVETFAGGADDLAWYRELFEGTPAPKGAQDAPRARSLPKIRNLAFTRVAPGLKDAELAGLTEVKTRDRLAQQLDGIRRIALDELVARGSKQGRGVAERIFADVRETSANRAAAARHLAAFEGPEVAKRFLAAGAREASSTPMGLRQALAELLAGMDHGPTDKKLAAELEQAQGEHALFCLWALAGKDGAALEKELLARIDDGDRVALAAIERLALGASPKAVEALEELLEREWQQPIGVAALEALSRLRAGDPEWSRRLVELTSSAEREIRNAALELLGAAEAAPHAELLVAALAHADWSTRLAALGVLERLRTRAATGAIVARMGAEAGLIERRFGEALWRLSGRPFGSNAEAWKRWWEDEGPRFEPIGAAELAALAAEEEERRLRDTTVAADYFGLRIDSKRVLFILDLSGTMGEPLAGPLEGVTGDPRLQVAVREMIEVLGSFEEDTLFNLVTFTNVAERWKRGGLTPATPSTVEELIEYAQRLGTGGFTDIYGALREGFSDPEVDTIVLASDGEPEARWGSSIDDPLVIRAEVAAWNEYRYVTIHTVAIDAELEHLEWLARDSGGRYVEAR